ncbi:unnamed protein product [Rotaria sp. Silwood1]|nr:unnamed protein product [Rotaria sp. Silwood1]CAF3525014.1 unnamed protein product [Rotaria sp. Silwood1]CAF4773680.1 unnamed protein product [Rotaria sp. Silwood1]
MKKLMLQLLLAILAIVALYTVQVDSIDIDKSRVIVLPTPKPPIVIDRCIYCFLHPTATGCNPCKYGSPILNVPCGQGSRRCEALGGTCKYNQCDRAYCCPYEHRGCCPPLYIHVEQIIENEKDFRFSKGEQGVLTRICACRYDR